MGRAATRAGVLLAAAALLGGGPAAAAEPRPLTLEESLRLAAERNLRILSARHEAGELAQEVPKAFSEFFPKFRGEARYFLQAPRPAFLIPQGTSASVFTPPAAPGLPSTTSSRVLENVEIPAGQRTDYNLRLRLEQPLFAGHRITSAYAAARLDEQIGGTRVARARQEVAEQVQVAYFNVLKAEAAREAAEARVRLQEAEIRHTEGLVAGGRATANALPPLRAALAGAQQEAFEAAQEAQVALDDLKRLTGLDETEAVRPVHPPEERVLALEPSDAARMAQDQRPELRELALVGDRAREGITQARGGYYPRIGLFGLFDKQRRTPLNPRGEFVAGGLEATWNLGDWARTRHEVIQAELRHERAVAELRDRRAAVAQEARAALAGVRVAEHRAAALRAEVEAARTAAAVAEERLRGGVGVLRDVVVARAEATRALARYRAAVYDGYVARARLQRVLAVSELPTVSGGPPLSMDFSPDIESLARLASVPRAGAPRSSQPAPSEGAQPPAAPKAPDQPSPPAAAGALAGPPPAGPPSGGSETGAPTRPAAAGTESAPSPSSRPSPPAAVAARSAPRPAGPSPGRPAARPPAPERQAPPPGLQWLEARALPDGSGRFSVVAAAFGSREAAETFGRILEARGFGPLEVRPGGPGEAAHLIVLVGFRNPGAAERALRDARDQLAGAGPPAEGARDPGPAAPAAGRSTLSAASAPASPPPPKRPDAPARADAPPPGGSDRVAERGRSRPGPAADAGAAPEPLASGELRVPPGLRWLEPRAADSPSGRFDVALADLPDQAQAKAFARAIAARGFGPVEVRPSGLEEGRFAVILTGFGSGPAAERAARDARRLLGASPPAAGTPAMESGHPGTRASAPATRTGRGPGPAPGPARAEPGDPFPPPPGAWLPRPGEPRNADPPADDAPAPVSTGGGLPAPPAGQRVLAVEGNFLATVATFSRAEGAGRVAALLEARGFGPVRVERAGAAFRVTLTGFSTPETAERAARDARAILPGSGLAGQVGPRP